ncbi:hypothetical protein TREES_T100001658 [Tupaia chinensis]|uniref:Uncharacterized protein n=1 Tax=Tupaia chinensis TaxID=246437 RepID=L9KJ02_TUPCH|nr:hypothetical protein TREES_T100001658 [Tupaia chinensis]
MHAPISFQALRSPGSEGAGPGPRFTGGEAAPKWTLNPKRGLHTSTSAQGVLPRPARGRIDSVPDGGARRSRCFCCGGPPAVTGLLKDQGLMQS